jgi:hypothetical protein
VRTSARNLVNQGRYPYLGRRRMLNALGPDLAAKVTWPATETAIPNSRGTKVITRRLAVSSP